MDVCAVEEVVITSYFGKRSRRVHNINKNIFKGCRYGRIQMQDEGMQKM